MTNLTMQKALRQLIANDAYAMTFQTMGGYRTALLQHADQLLETPATCSQVHPDSALPSMAGYDNTAQQYSALAAGAQSYATGGIVPGGLHLAGEGLQPLHSQPEGEGPQAERKTIREVFEHVGGHWTGSDNLCPTFGSAEALRIYTVKMQRDAVQAALAAQSQGAQAARVECKAEPGAWSECQWRTIEMYTTLQGPKFAAQQAAAPGALDADEMTRLRRLMRALGMADDGGNDEYVRGILFTVLGQAAGQIERATNAPGTPEAPADQDAARYQWLKERFTGYDFYWGGDPMAEREEDKGRCVIVFECGQDFRAGRDFEPAIDAAIKRDAQLDGGQGEAEKA